MDEHTYTISIEPYTIERDGRWYPALRTIVNGGEPVEESTEWNYATEAEALKVATIVAVERRQRARKAIDAILEQIRKIQSE